MNEDMENRFKEITYTSVVNLFESLKERINDVFPSEKYHDVWLVALFDGIIDMVNILLGELYTENQEDVVALLEQIKSEMESKYTDKRTVILHSLLSILAIHDDENFDINSLVNATLDKPSRRHEIAYM